MSSAAMVSRRMRLSAKATSSGIVGVEVMADHQHVEMLVERVDRVGPGRVGRATAARSAAPQTLMMSGAWPPPAPSVWKAWMVRPLKAASVSSTKPDSFSVSVWIVTCTSYSSATDRQQSMAAGVVPQSSCSLRPQAPASICSTSACGLRGVALAGEAEVHREARRPPASMRARCQGPGVQVVAAVPVAGPVPPPSIVVMPRVERLVDLLRADEVDVLSMPPAVRILPSPAIDLGAGADDDVDAGLDVGIAGLADAGDAAVAGCRRRP